MKKFLAFLLLLISLVFVSSCDINTTPDEPRRISTKDVYVDMYIGASCYLDYSLNFHLEAGESLEFITEDSTIAAVLSDGQVIARSKGSTKVTVKYSEDIFLTFFVTVMQHIELTAPLKTDYYVGEDIDLTGCILSVYNSKGAVTETLDVLNSMVSGFDTTTVGEKEVIVTYQSVKYSFKINVKELNNEAYLVSSLVFPEVIKQNEKLEIKVVNESSSLLASKLSSYYDYDEYELKLDISKDSNTDTITAFYYQDFTQKKTNTTLNTSNNLEGMVNNATGYSFKYTYTKKGDPTYMFRYMPEEVGTYSYKLSVIVNGGSKVQELTGTFEVVAGNESKGIVKVSDNKRTFEYSDGTTYLPVGENICWYTSKERRIGDYELWFSRLNQVGGNFARVWMAPWGFSLFWKDVDNYSTRLDEAYELDQLFDMASQYGLQIDLCLFNHGMFSKKINPMWPGASNTWYIGKYGANSFSTIVSNGSDFFSDSTCKKWTKNYIQYVISRYGYSDNLMCYELFNEVDWIEGYTEEIGTEWHKEMSKFIKANDYRGHLVTTSTKDDSFGTVSNVFKLSTIDFACVHAYGSSNYLSYIPSKYYNGYGKYNKPIMWQEVGLSGTSGTEQLTKDPSSVSLSQELWAGLMSCGSTGMNWWWESWIQAGNAYSKFVGPAKASSLMDLSGTMTLIYSNKNAVKVDTGSTPLGYKFDNRCYLYIYSNSYSYKNTGNNVSTNVNVYSLQNGTYEVNIYNTLDGSLVGTKDYNVSNSTLTFGTSYTDDTFITIIKK